MTHSMKIYSLYDRKAQYYLPPFALQSDAEAERAFANLVTTSETPVSQYPADFDLCRLGGLDLEKGTLHANASGMVDLLINGLVMLEAAQRQRARYNAVLQQTQNGVDLEETFPEAS